MKNPRGHLVLLVLAVVFGGGVWWQARANQSLREEQARLRAAAEESARLKADRTRLQASHVEEDELQKRVQDSAEVAELRARIEKLKQEEAKALQPAPKKPEERWKNLGLAKPTDTLQSVVWAATGGEVEQLAAMLAYDPECRAALDALYAALPEGSRRLFPNADLFMATVVSSRLPTSLKKVQPVEQTQVAPDLIAASFQLQSSSDPRVEPRSVVFRFQRDGADWKLLVPKTVVEEFRRSLNAK